MKKSNHAVGECYKAGEFIDLHRDLNTHDPDNKYVWANNKPWWLTPLQVLGFVATGIGLTLCIYYATLILFLL